MCGDSLIGSLVEVVQVDALGLDGATKVGDRGEIVGVKRGDFCLVYLYANDHEQLLSLSQLKVVS